MALEALIVGGGIGGLVTALDLHAAGIGVRIFEAAQEVKPLGVGINLLPHSVRHLDRLGCLDRLLELGIPISEQRFYNRQGQHIWTDPRGMAAGYRWPQIGIHRGELQVALLAIVRERIPADRIHLGCQLTGFEETDDGVIGHLMERATHRRFTMKGDVLIGADGIHSTIRHHFYPDEGPAKWNGALIFRAVTETDPFLSGTSQFMAGGRQTIIGYPISQRYRAQGRSLTNWAARFFIDPSSGFAREDWNRRGRLEDLLPRYADWTFDFLDIPAVMRGATAIWEFPMVDRDPLPRWSHGRVTLLGDAAHPMYPLGSNGASQAILDAHALVQALTGYSGVKNALEAYEAERRPRTAQIVLQNRAGGPERIVSLCEERAPAGFTDLEAVLPAQEMRGILDRYKALASFDLASVNGP